MTQLIWTWKDLQEYANKHPSRTHTLRCNLCFDNAWLYPKVEGVKKYYLSTHIFYPEKCEESTKILQECGFDVILISWGAIKC